MHTSSSSSSSIVKVAALVGMSLSQWAMSAVGQAVVVPPGAVLPSGALPTVNPFAPARPSATPTDDATSGSTLKTINFVKNDFFIGIAVVFGVIGLAVGLLVVYRRMKGGDVDREEINARFEREQKALLERTNTLKRNMSQRSQHPPTTQMPPADVHSQQHPYLAEQPPIVQPASFTPYPYPAQENAAYAPRSTPGGGDKSFE